MGSSLSLVDKFSQSNPHSTPVIPRQKLSRREKTGKWAENTMEAIDVLAAALDDQGRSSKHRKQVNYDLMNSIFNEDDLNYVLNPYNIPEEKFMGSPAKIRDINIVSSKVNLHRGEEMTRPFDWKVMGLGGESLNTTLTRRNEIIRESLQRLVNSLIDPSTIPTDPVTGQKVLPPEPQKVVDEFDKTYRERREELSGKLMKILIKNDNIEEKFNKGMFHALVAGEEFYYTGIRNGHPTGRVVNPLGFEFDKNPSCDRVEDSKWAREERYLSSSQVIDEYGEFLTDDEVRRIDRGDVGHAMNSSKYFPEFAYRDKPHSNRDNYYNSTRSHIRVADFAWRALRKIGFLTWIDEEGDLRETIVDESFKLTEEHKEAGFVIEWQWIDEIWEGTRIGDDIFPVKQPIPNQIADPRRIGRAKLPFIGRIYNNINSEGRSLVDLLKPHQYLYNITWFRLENEMAKAKGKAFIMDLAYLPKSEGMDIDKWIQYLDNGNIAFINSFEEGQKGVNKGRSPNFNGFTSIDRTMSQVIGQYIAILEKIESLVSVVSGVSPQREAQIQSRETVGGIERSINQSANITEPIFFEHNSVKEQYLNQLLRLAQIAYADGGKLSGILDNGERIVLEIDGELLNDSELGIFVTNSSRDSRIFRKIELLAENMIASGAAELNDVVNVLTSGSLSEATNIVQKAIDKRRDQAERQSQAERETQISVERERTTRELAKEDREDERARLDREKDIRVAQIKALTDLGITDQDANDVLDVLEIEKFRTDRENKRKELEQKDKELELKDKEIDTKLKVAKENKNRFDIKNKNDGNKTNKGKKRGR